MSQTNIIVGSILFGFFVFITVKGELPNYLAVYTVPNIWGEGGSNSGTTTSGSGIVGGTVGAGAATASTMTDSEFGLLGALG